MQGKKATIKDIAREAGYSKTAVSFAFNDPSRISVQAKEKILAVADRLGYIPDPMARNFSLHRHMSLGFLLPQNVESSLGNPYIDQVIEGIGIICQKQDYTLTLIPPLEGSAVNAVRSAMVDGLIAMGMQVGMDIVEILDTRKLPYVTIDGIASKEMPSVNIKDEEAAYEIMKLVLKYGHRSIALVSLTPDAFTKDSNADTVPRRRVKGYVRALKEQGLDFYDGKTLRQFACDCSFEDGYAMGKDIASLPSRPTAIVTMSDIVAIGCISALKDQGIKVPEEISVVGFDNDSAASYVTPPLTTVDQPALEKGKMAAEAIFSLIANETIRNPHMEIPFSIIERESLSRPKE
jgi:DNA-binding LacI/PurR family transcriptional regulator